MWLSSRQPFVTHSTAEVELVTYCGGLLAGRSSLKLFCVPFWGEEEPIEPLPDTSEPDRSVIGNDAGRPAPAVEPERVGIGNDVGRPEPASKPDRDVILGESQSVSESPHRIQ